MKALRGWLGSANFNTTTCVCATFMYLADLTCFWTSYFFSLISADGILVGLWNSGTMKNMCLLLFIWPALNILV